MELDEAFVKKYLPTLLLFTPNVRTKRRLDLETNSIVVMAIRRDHVGGPEYAVGARVSRSMLQDMRVLRGSKAVKRFLSAVTKTLSSVVNDDYRKEAYELNDWCACKVVAVRRWKMRSLADLRHFREWRRAYYEVVPRAGRTHFTARTFNAMTVSLCSVLPRVPDLFASVIASTTCPPAGSRSAIFQRSREKGSTQGECHG